MTLDYFYGQAGELFSFYRIPKALFQEQQFQDLSTDAKTLYGILLDRMSLSVKNEWFDKKGRVFIIFTIEDVKRALCCADNKATKPLRELEKFGLIERKRRGLGKPSLVYVKNFSAESSKSIFQNRDFHDSGGFKNASQDPSKSRCNKTKENDTEMSETDPFYSEESDEMSKRTQLEEFFSQSLEVELLLRLCPDDEDTIYQIVDLLVDTCATNRKLLRIAGDDKPAEVVRSRFMKLNADHICFVLKRLAENSSPIRNMKQYLLASLYANYSEEDNPLSLKADFILSLCELVVGGKEGLLPVEKTVIDRCVHLIYRKYFANPCPENMPILEDLYNALLQQDEKEAHHVATALEIYVKGSLNLFNHRTNVNVNNRIVCYDIKELGKQVKKLGMLIVQDQVWGRVTANRSSGKSTRYYMDEMHLLLKEEQTAAYLGQPGGSTRTIFRQSTIFPPRMPSLPSAQQSAT